ncbi:hypothetical protein HD806DRAFT_536562 [Xylariaceae sp. AK1471]|nr:hypothetical protein HD806DRAFT_536562 [Xylariaceae sp. AK1471]
MAPSLGTANIVVSSIFSVVAIVAVALRFQARITRSQGLSVDDYMSIPALVFTVGFGINNIIGSTVGSIGAHIFEVPVLSIVTTLKTVFAGTLILIASAVFTRLSIVHFYRVTLAKYGRAIYVTILLCIIYAWGISFFLTSLLSCMPIKAQWQPTTPATCLNQQLIVQAMLISNVIINALLLLAPVSEARKLLSAPLQKKIVLGGTLILGFVVIIISILRAYFTIGESSSFDITYDQAKINIYAEVEASLLIVCACLPTLVVSPSHIQKQQHVEDGGRYEKPELPADDVPRPRPLELDDTGVVELAAPVPELSGSERATPSMGR